MAWGPLRVIPSDQTLLQSSSGKKLRIWGVDSYRVSLYGSLSLTGRGHLSDEAILTGLGSSPCEIIWCDEELPFHPNGMKFEALGTDGQVVSDWITYSIGGGELQEEGASTSEYLHIYNQKSMEEVLAWCSNSGKPIWQLVVEVEEDAKEH